MLLPPYFSDVLSYLKVAFNQGPCSGVKTTESRKGKNTVQRNPGSDWHEKF